MTPPRSVVVLLCLLGVLGAPAATLGCTLEPATESERYFDADVVFAGTVVGRQDPLPPDAPLIGSGDPVTWTFRVEEVTRGTAESLQAVVSVRGEATCGYGFAVGGRYAVFARASGSGGLVTGLGAGTRTLAAGEPAPRYASRGMTLAAAGRFRWFPLYWVGPEFRGLPLSTIIRRGAFVTFIYGSCAPISGGCAPPLEVQVVRTCRATVAVKPLARRTMRRGVKSGSGGGGLVLLSGRERINVFAGGGLGRRAIAALRGMNTLAADVGPDGPLPPTMPDAERRVPCPAPER